MRMQKLDHIRVQVSQQRTMAQSQMISKGISDTDAPENALYLGGNLNQTSYMEEGGGLTTSAGAFMVPPGGSGREPGGVRRAS